jgi:gas vesicle protein
MLKGVRTAVKYFTIGLLAGVLLAPRKGDETRKLLVERGKEYAQEAMGAAHGQGQHAT